MQPKLKAYQIYKIRKLWATGKYVQRELGEMFGCTQMNISYIVRRINWPNPKKMNVSGHPRAGNNYGTCYCHATGCGVRVPHEMWMCPWCWRKCPEEFKRPVWLTFKRGTYDEDHLTLAYSRAARGAIRAVAKLSKIKPDTKLYDKFIKEHKDDHNE